MSNDFDFDQALKALQSGKAITGKDLSELGELAARWNPATYFFGTEATDELKSEEENFHLELARISHNEVLRNYLLDINDHIRVVRRLGWPDSRSVEDTYKEHFSICQLLLDRNIKGAQKEIVKHIRKSQEQANRVTLHQLYDRQSIVNFD